MPAPLTDDEFEELTEDLPAYTRNFPEGSEKDWQKLEEKVGHIEREVKELKGEESERSKRERRIERKALHLVLDDLREKGASEKFLQQNMYKIKERVHDVLFHE